jgi:sugar lactone lactonase YvrE
VWIVDAAGGESRVVSSGAGADDGVNGLAWTTDGRLVYTSASGGNLDIPKASASPSRRRTAE